MKLKLAFKCLPYILIEKDLGTRTLGSSKYFFVWLDDKPLSTTDEHEEWHILWWYAVTLLGAIAMSPLFDPWWFGALFAINIDPVLGTVFKRYKKLEESFAYAYEASHAPDPQRYLNDIAESAYHNERYDDDFGKLVTKRYNKYFK